MFGPLLISIYLEPMTYRKRVAYVFPNHNWMTPMSITCFIRYEIDPAQLDAFEQYARSWGEIIPRCGGRLIGYFIPHEGTNYEAWGLISFDDLAAYESYRARIKADAAGRANFSFAREQRFIAKEERTFLREVPGTRPLPSHGAHS